MPEPTFRPPVPVTIAKTKSIQTSAHLAAEALREVRWIIPPNIFDRVISHLDDINRDSIDVMNEVMTGIKGRTDEAMPSVTPSDRELDYHPEY